MNVNKRVLDGKDESLSKRTAEQHTAVSTISRLLSKKAFLEPTVDVNTYKKVHENVIFALTDNAKIITNIIDYGAINQLSSANSAYNQLLSHPQKLEM